MPVAIRTLRRGDEAVLDRVAPDVFDDPLDARATAEFLGDPRHHLVVAIEEDVVVGFISSVHYVHPDKPRPELWINEVGVAPPAQGRGIGKALLAAVLRLGREAGCAEAWVLTERSNAAAMHLYASLGGVADPGETVLFSYSLQPGRSPAA